MKVLKEGAVILTKKEAKNLLLIREDGMVHTFFNIRVGLIGGDHSKESVFKDIDQAAEVQLAGSAAQQMGHALAIFKCLPINHDQILFCETVKEKVDKLQAKVKK